jgi:hypothetical protein
MLYYPLRSPRLNHILLQLKLKKPPSSLSGSKTSTNRFSISYRSPMTSSSNTMIKTECHISFRLATNFGCTSGKNVSHDPIRILSHFVMGLTPSPRMWVIISLEINLPHFLGLHPMFNVDLLRSYFPPLLDTPEVEEQMKPKDLNLDYIQHESNDHIVEK